MTNHHPANVQLVEDGWVATIKNDPAMRDVLSKGEVG
jgi:hypothetical protein